jgi:hypothetical protein
MDEITFTSVGERVLREAENFCWHASLPIVTAEHVLAAALLVNNIVPKATLEAALALVLGEGEPSRSLSVKFGSSGREALSTTMLAVRSAGGDGIGAADLARGAIASGEVRPAFYGALGRSREELLGALG